MSEGADITDPDERMLARVAALDLAAAERVHARMMAAEDDARLCDLGRTYQRMARSVRQTLALKAKLKQDRERAASNPQAAPRKVGGAAIARRITELRDAVTRVIRAEAPDIETADWHAEALEDTITDEMLKDGFAVETLDDHVARIGLALGLDAETLARWRELPEAAPDEGSDDEPPQESSA